MQAITGSTTLKCLISLIGIQSKPCVPGSTPALFIEQLDGVDIDKLSKIASTSDVSGVEYAKRLINTSAMEMIGELDLMLNNGYSIKQNIAEVCSTCEFNSIYVPGGGTKVFSSSLSPYSQIKITSLKIKANATGSHYLKLDDGVNPLTYPIELEDGVIMPIILDYSTSQKIVYISLVDQSVGLAQIICPSSNSCGCGGATAKNMIHYSGTVGGIATSIQYGFLVCANISCSNESLVCEMIRQTPNIFGLTLLYKVGEKVNNDSKISLRNNRATAANDDEKDFEIFKYSALYRKRMNGSNTEKGIKHLISDYLRTKARDVCIVCNSSVKVSYATG